MLLNVVAFLALRNIKTREELVDDKLSKLEARQATDERSLADRFERMAEKRADDIERIHVLERRVDATEQKVTTLERESQNGLAQIARQLDKRSDAQDASIDWIAERLGRKASRSELKAFQIPGSAIPRSDPDSDKPPPPRGRFPSRGGGE